MTRPLFATLLLLLTACAPLRQGSELAGRWEPSPNHGPRQASLVVLHYTSNDDTDTALRTLTDPLREVSAHYLVGRDGDIVQLVDETRRAWHAGASRWGGIDDVNSVSIGIELDNNGFEPYPPAQIDALLLLLADLKLRLSIPTANFVGHADVAPRRKLDPGPLFPWRILAEYGFGLWCDTPDPALIADPLLVDVAAALRGLGYDTSDLEAARAAFRLHHLPDADEPTAALLEAATMDCLLRQRDAPATP
jgi:N-acetylmuramoyl-L-alanine amidase